MSNLVANAPEPARPNAAWSADPGDLNGGERGLDLGRVLWNHKLLVLFFTAVGVGLGYLQFSKTPPVFASRAQLLVVREQQKLPVDSLLVQQPQKDPVKTHTVLIKSPSILRKAIEGKGLGSLTTLARSHDPVATVSASLTVDVSAVSNEVLELTYVGADRFECEKILNGVIAAYIEFLKESQSATSVKTVKMITDAKEELLESLKRKDHAYQQFRAETKLIWDGDGVRNVHQQRMTDIESRRSKMRIERSQLKADLDSVHAAIERGSARDAILLMVDRGLLPKVEQERRERLIAEAEAAAAEANAAAKAAADASMQPEPEEVVEAPADPIEPMEPATITSLRTKLMDYKIQEELLLQQVGAQHPNVQKVRRQIDLTQRFLDQALAQMPRPAPKPLPKPNRVRKPAAAPVIASKPIIPPQPETDWLAMHVTSKEEELSLMEKKLTALDEEFEREQESARDLAQDELRDQALREDKERTKRLFDVLVEKLQEMSLQKDTDLLNAEVITPPGIGIQIAPRFETYGGAGGVLGLMLGFGLALLLETLDNRFRGPEELVQHLRLPILGHIPAADAARARKLVRNREVHPMVISFHRPKSALSEAYRAVRTSLLFGMKGRRVIQITSPDPGDGKSTLSSNLAITLAASGKRVLLIDADMRKPRAHQLFGRPNAVGLSTVLAGDDVAPEECIQETCSDTLWVMTAGPRTDRPAELLLSENFSRMLEHVKSKFDFVLVDTPPVLAVTDASAVAAHVDGVVLVVRINNRMRRHSTRAKEALELLGANLLGVVVNGLGEASKYGYGQTAYGYGMRYGNDGRPYGSDSYFGADSEEPVAASS